PCGHATASRASCTAGLPVRLASWVEGRGPAEFAWRSLCTELTPRRPAHDVRAASLGDSGAVLTHRTHQVPAGRQEERHVALHPSPAVLAGVAVGTLLAGLAYGTLSGSAPLPEGVELRASQASPVAPSGSQVTGTQAA